MTSARRGTAGSPLRGAAPASWQTRLSHKEGWRRYVEQEPPVRPEPLTMAELLRLGDTAREAYDEARHDWHAKLGAFRTPALSSVHEALDEIVASNRQGADRVRGAAVLDAPAGLGKTTSVNEFGRRFDRAQRARRGPRTIDGHEHLPVFRIGLTSNTTLRTFNRMICEFYGHPGTERANAARLGSLATDCVLSCGTQVGIIDDLHFVDLTQREGINVSNHLKWLANEMPITFIYVGVGLAEKGYFSEGRPGYEASLAQSARRWTRISMEPFEIVTPEGRADWIALLKATERELVLAGHRRGALEAMAEFLHDRTTGHIGTLMTLIARGCWRAIRRGTERLSEQLLDGVPLDLAAEQARRRRHPGTPPHSAAAARRASHTSARRETSAPAGGPQTAGLRTGGQQTGGPQTGEAQTGRAQSGGARVGVRRSPDSRLAESSEQ